jgi:hypothetical protein
MEGKKGRKTALLEMLNPCVLAKPSLYKHMAHLSVLLSPHRRWKELEGERRAAATSASAIAVSATSSISLSSGHHAR